MDWIELGVSLCYVVLGAIILMIAKFVNDLLTPYALDEELTVRDNPAIGLSLSGYYAGVMIIFLGASTGTEGELLDLNRLLPELGVVAALGPGRNRPSQSGQKAPGQAGAAPLQHLQGTGQGQKRRDRSRALRGLYRHRSHPGGSDLR